MLRYIIGSAGHTLHILRLNHLSVGIVACAHLLHHFYLFFDSEDDVGVEVGHVGHHLFRVEVDLFQ